MQRRTRVQAFTLVELLVVIGIIAVLVAILLPALQSARRQASAVQCSSNMKQLALGMLMYIQQNKGRFPASAVAPGSPIYPMGWWWANELVKQKYVNAPNGVRPDGTRDFSGASVFRCPEGIEPQQLPSTGSGRFPTDWPNNGQREYSDEDQLPPVGIAFGIPSWYQLVSSNLGGGNIWPHPTGGGSATPFVYFNNGLPGSILDARRSRHMGMIRKSAVMVMICEAAEANMTLASGAQPADNTNLTPRLGARHGKKSATGRDAWTNFAFFDGHVATMQTEGISRTGFGGMREAQGAIFYIPRQYK